MSSVIYLGSSQTWIGYRVARATTLDDSHAGQSEVPGGRAPEEHWRLYTTRWEKIKREFIAGVPDWI